MSYFPESKTSFDNEFDLTERDLKDVVIKETNKQDRCLIWDNSDSSIAYESFVIKKNSRSKTVCEINFYKSSETGKYIPRLNFKRVRLDGSDQFTKSEKNVSIPFNESASASIFWKLINFLYSYKELVETGSFDSIYKVVPKNSYITEFKNKSEKQKFEDLKEFVEIADLPSNYIESLTFLNRKKNLEAFFALLKNKQINGRDSHSLYRTKFEIRGGEEYIWHHFLSKNDWILGLNTDLKFVIDYIDEQSVGIANSKKRKDPAVDLMGISEFTVLVELKHSNTKVFKSSKSKGRANTWDFTSDFIEGISQCLGQKFELEKSFDLKEFEKSDGKILNKSETQTIDPKSILLLGNKKKEFPVNDLVSENLTKNKTLERFRRNNRNIYVLTYDELFERAYHIVFSKKLNTNWYWEDEKNLFV